MIGVLATLLWYAGGIVFLAAFSLLLLFVADLYTYVPFARAAKQGRRLGNVRYKVIITKRTEFTVVLATCAAGHRSHT